MIKTIKKIFKLQGENQQNVSPTQAESRDEEPNLLKSFGEYVSNLDERPMEPPSDMQEMAAKYPEGFSAKLLKRAETGRQKSIGGIGE